jgi:hypothetical protein
LDSPLGSTGAVQLNEDERVFRWVHKYGIDYKKDGSFKKFNASIFRIQPDVPEENGMSLWAERLLSEAASAAKAHNENEKKGHQLYMGQMALEVGVIRECQLDVKQFPLPEDGGEAHFQIVGHQSFDETYLTDVRRKFLKAATPTYKALSDFP